jgi:hypothetical protein
MLGPYAHALLPAVMYRIAQPGTGCWHHVRRDLLHGLATWHNQAADAAAALTPDGRHPTPRTRGPSPAG